MHSLLKERKRFRGDPMQKVLNAIRKVRFTKSTLRASIREKKGQLLGKNKCRFLVSEVPHAPKFEDRPTKRLDDKSDVPNVRLGILPKNNYKLTENDRATFFSPTKKWVLPSASSRESEEREFVVDSRASMLSWRP